MPAGGFTTKCTKFNMEVYPVVFNREAREGYSKEIKILSVVKKSFKGLAAFA